MIPSINALTRVVTKLGDSVEDFKFQQKVFTLIGEHEKAKEYQAAAHDFSQVVIYLCEHIESRDPKTFKRLKKV